MSFLGTTAGRRAHDDPGVKDGRLVLSQVCGLRLWGADIKRPRHLEVKPKADKSSRKARRVPTQTRGGGRSEDGPVPTTVVTTPMEHWREVKMSHDSLPNFASCQSSLGPLSVSQGTFTPSNLKLLQLTQSLPAPKGYGGS